MMIEPGTASLCRITPCQIRKPASVTTNDGTPTRATIEPCPKPITTQMAMPASIASSPLIWCPLPGSWSSATATAPTPAT